ncbi:MAG: hypothetical protein M0R00_06390 [Candidatus Omnitrophica bacterium]|jgi:hypothetical protein|nr:hypothetical protein [Candidatus Omnitrophota bacterium]
MSNGYVNPWWQSVLLPYKWDVSGIDILTMSVWHSYALYNLFNPYICGGVHNRDAAANLLLICRLDMNGGWRLYLDARARDKALARIHKRISPLKFDELDCACTDYCLACTRTPEHKRLPSNSGGKLMSGPPHRHIVLCLCDHYGMTVGEAWNRHYAMARCEYDIWREATGDESLVSPSLQMRNDISEEKRFLENK